MEEEEIRSQKQQFLREKIIEGGYDAGAFTQMLESEKEDGKHLQISRIVPISSGSLIVDEFLCFEKPPGMVDGPVSLLLSFLGKSSEKAGSNIDVWTFEELKELTERFMLQSTTGNSTSEINQPMASLIPPPSAEAREESKEPFSAVQSVLNDPIFEEELSKTIICKRKRETTRIGQTQNIKIILSDPQVRPGGLLTSSYVTYKVITLPFKDFQVFRRYSDFEWLHGSLKKNFPGLFIPPLHQKSTKRSFEKEYLQKRMKFLEVIDLNSQLFERE